MTRDDRTRRGSAGFTLIEVLAAVFLTAIVISVAVAASIQIADQWEKAVVLRMGAYRGLRGPGFFFIIPLLDYVSHHVDQRIRARQFKAETTLTKDTVPVNVDAIAFWMVWDAQKSVLEVEHFDEAVVLSAQTAMPPRG